MNTITVASRLHNAIRIRDFTKTAVLNGANHESAIAGVGFTHGVDPALFNTWMDKERRTGSAMVGQVYEVDPGEAEKKVPTEYGFQPGLDRAKAAG